MTNPAAHSCQLILALDVDTRERALALLDQLDGSVHWVKIGLRLFTAYGPDFVREIAGRGHSIFLDLKLHDIPNTVAGAVRSIAALPVHMLTLHASGGSEMLAFANRARAEHAPDLELLAVTVLTSLDEPQLRALNVRVPPGEQVLHLARMAMDAGLRGVVSSPLEIAPIRASLGTGPLLVTPGIRPVDARNDEQKRITTPRAAASLGADFIVVGRPILRAPDPAEAARAIRAELEPRPRNR